MPNATAPSVRAFAPQNNATASLSAWSSRGDWSSRWSGVSVNELRGFGVFSTRVASPEIACAQSAHRARRSTLPTKRTALSCAFAWATALHRRPQKQQTNVRSCFTSAKPTTNASPLPLTGSRSSSSTEFPQVLSHAPCQQRFCFETSTRRLRRFVRGAAIPMRKSRLNTSFYKPAADFVCRLSLLVHGGQLLQDRLLGCGVGLLTAFRLQATVVPRAELSETKESSPARSQEAILAHAAPQLRSQASVQTARSEIRKEQRALPPCLRAWQQAMRATVECRSPCWPDAMEASRGTASPFSYRGFGARVFGVRSSYFGRANFGYPCADTPVSRRRCRAGDVVGGGACEERHSCVCCTPTSANTEA